MLIGVGRPARARQFALPPEEQDAVNHAIDEGVRYLKLSQFKNGTWAKPGTAYQAGYSALPGLTLLECGVPANDPIVQRTARFLRAKGTAIDRTYELALGILFLDRLGDPKDRKLIQTLALRLIAGQSATGGWGYKCPVLPASVQAELLAALRHLNPPLDGGPPGGGDPANLPGIAMRPDRPPDERRPIRRAPGDLAPIGKVPSDLPGLVPAVKSSNPINGTSHRDSPGNGNPGSSSSSQSSLGEKPGLLREWLGFHSPAPAPATAEDKKDNKDARDDKPKGKAARPNEDKKDRKAGDAQAADDKPAAPRKPFVIPERLRLLPVIQDPELLLLIDPKGKRHDLIVSTTDNSNTQFAILALWTAQRHGVPVERSLKLIVRRFLTSQNADGSWGYDYVFGGGGESRPSMTCVGLIGLAVGYGLANEPAGGRPVRDPRIIQGLIALSNSIGQPANRIVNLPMQNLYFLWSLERAAVLYKLPKIGDKDWYRWGAQILVANQEPKGNWANGQYHGSSPPLDTCLALLFLRRANLVSDLTAKLPFQAADLNDGIKEKLAPRSAPKNLEPLLKTTAKEEPSKAEEQEKPIAKPVRTLEGIPAAPSSDLEGTASGGSKKKWVGLGIVLFVVVFGGGLFFFLFLAKRREDEEEEQPHSRKKSPRAKARTQRKSLPAGS